MDNRTIREEIVARLTERFPGMLPEGKEQIASALLPLITAAREEGQAEHEFEVWQDDMPVAMASSTDRDTALREIRHYAAVYRQDGPVEIKEVIRRSLPPSQ